MSLDAWLTIAILAAVLIALLATRLQPVVVFLGALTVSIHRCGLREDGPAADAPGRGRYSCIGADLLSLLALDVEDRSSADCPY